MSHQSSLTGPLNQFRKHFPILYSNEFPSPRFSAPFFNWTSAPMRCEQDSMTGNSQVTPIKHELFHQSNWEYGQCNYFYTPNNGSCYPLALSRVNLPILPGYPIILELLFGDWRRFGKPAEYFSRGNKFVPRRRRTERPRWRGRGKFENFARGLQVQWIFLRRGKIQSSDNDWAPDFCTSKWGLL